MLVLYFFDCFLITFDYFDISFDFKFYQKNQEFFMNGVTIGILTLWVEGGRRRLV